MRLLLKYVYVCICKKVMRLLLKCVYVCVGKNGKTKKNEQKNLNNTPSHAMHEGWIPK